MCLLIRDGCWCWALFCCCSFIWIVDNLIERTRFIHINTKIRGKTKNNKIEKPKKEVYNECLSMEVVCYVVCLCVVAYCLVYWIGFVYWIVLFFLLLFVLVCCCSRIIVKANESLLEPKCLLLFSGGWRGWLIAESLKSNELNR